MKYVDEYRNRDRSMALVREIERTARRPWTLMEVCGGQTHAIMKYGLDRLLPERLTLLHGPGCPVCVTPARIIDRAVEIALRPDVVMCSFGDMMRVPGTGGSLNRAKAQGGDVRVVYSPLDALAIAEAAPDREVVFLAIGFETTAPMTAMAVRRAAELGLENFSLLASHVRVPPALEAIMTSDGPHVHAFLAAGHVCTIMGLSEYDQIAERHGVPVVATGFEPMDILEGVLMALRQLEAATSRVEIQYARVVSARGNRTAQVLISSVFEVADQEWRGVGVLPASGLRLAPAYAAFDASKKFKTGAVGPSAAETSSVCISGSVLRGAKKPPECPSFGAACTPETPLGATMVSSEGACAAYYRYSGKFP